MPNSTLKKGYVRTWETSLGGETVHIHAPEHGTREWLPEWEKFSRTTEKHPMWGLDTEFAIPEEQGSFWAPDFSLRLVQIGSKTDAWVFRTNDPYQMSIVSAFLQDERNQFCSHTDADVHALQAGLGIDISARNWNTHVIARMNSEQSFLYWTKKGRQFSKYDLKHIATCYGMPQLGNLADCLKTELSDIGRREAGFKKASKKAESWGWANISLDNERYLIYAGMDAIAVRRILDRLCAETGAPNALLKADANSLNAVTVGMRHRGMRLDIPQAEKVYEECNARIVPLNVGIKHVTGYDYKQRQRLGEWIIEHGLDTDTYPTTETGRVSFNKKDVPLLRQQPLDAKGREFVRLYLQVVEEVNALTSTKGYLERVDGNGFVHPTFHVVGAITGRLSAADPNVMNVDPKLRRLFLPHNDDQVIIGFDFSQVELRVLGSLAREPRMLDVYDRGGDLHQQTRDLLGCDRKLAKIVNFMVVYGGGANAVNVRAGCGMDEAQKMVQGFWRSYPKAKEFRDVLSRFTDYVETFVGRKIPVSRQENGELATYRNLNYVVQSTARELLASAVLRMLEMGIAGYIWDLIHDETVVCVDRADVEEMRQLFAEAMRGEGHFFGVPIVVDTKVYLDAATGLSRWGK